MTEITEITLRPARLDDVDAMTAICHRTVLAKYPSVIGREKVEGYVASGAVAAYNRDRNAHCTVAERAGDIIGVYGLRDNSVDLMMVALEHQRSGVGSILLADAELKLFAEHQNLFLNSFRDNAQANRFYAKHGWKLEKEYLDAEHDIPMVRLVKSRTAAPA